MDRAVTRRRPHGDRESPQKNVTELHWKFLFGFIAGLVAAMLPRLITALTAQIKLLELFPPSFLVASLAFSALIGLAIAVE